ncbi:MAG: hypothetical protein IH932_02305 [Thaumarchaeota archaeon]|nr:hypothetical protein [Nitrososphaerota archaeon]
MDSSTIILYLNAIPKSSIFGGILILLSTTLYYFAQSRISFITIRKVAQFETLAYYDLAILFIGILLVLIGLSRYLSEAGVKVRAFELVPIRSRWIVPYILSTKKYGRLFVISSIIYGLFYSFITSLIVYQPNITFSTEYLVSVPSALVIPFYGAPGQIPVLVVYITEHLGLLLIPLSVILLVTVSLLVGLNISMAAFAYANRPKNYGGQWLGGFGGIVGLFTGCPTCAGLFLANIVGGAGAASVSTLLASSQSFFIGISIPILIITPILISKSLAKVFEGGCLTPSKVA